jgi:hypothetical protein
MVGSYPTRLPVNYNKSTSLKYRKVALCTIQSDLIFLTRISLRFRRFLISYFSVIRAISVKVFMDDIVNAGEYNGGHGSLYFLSGLRVLI